LTAIARRLLTVLICTEFNGQAEFNGKAKRVVYPSEAARVQRMDAVQSCLHVVDFARFLLVFWGTSR
jgi:hypothetical protein